MTYTGVSYWLETADDDLTPRPRLDGSTSVDVAILGAGYSGLWTAYHLLMGDPSLKVMLVEREIAGFGASGRNGAWCTSGFPTSYATLADRYGTAVAVDTYRAMVDSVNGVGAFADRHGVDIQWRKGGNLTVARGPQQMASVVDLVAEFAGLGLEPDAVVLSPEEVAKRVRITDVVAGAWLPETAAIHPGKLVRGLARVVEGMGATIVEQTPVAEVVGGSAPVLRTPHGDVRAKVVVLCGEAYMAHLDPVGRTIMPVYSLITLTERLSESDRAEIGWDGNDCIHSCRYTVDYLSRTADGRILFGGRGAPYHFGSKIEPTYDRHAETHGMLMANVHAWFPMLKNVRFTHTWGGPLGWPRDFMPTMAYDKATGIATTRGYTGNGVATAHLGGRVVADLILGRETGLTALPWVNRHARKWEPEPFRYLGVRYVQRSFATIDAKAERTGVPPTGNTLAERLTRH